MKGMLRGFRLGSAKTSSSSRRPTKSSTRSRPRPSHLAAKRCKQRLQPIVVLYRGDPGFDETLEYALRGPLYDALETRLRFMPTEEVERLLRGLEVELERRRKGG